MNRQSAFGFTLLEVLVALAIISLALTGALRALGSTTVASEGLRERTLASWVALNRLTELRITYTFPDIGTTQGKATQGGQEFIWRMDVAYSPNPLFRKVDITVLRGDGSATPISRMRGFVVRPLT